MYKWFKDKKLTDQMVRKISTVGLPEVILPENVVDLGIKPFVIPAKPAITNLQIVVEDGYLETDTEVTQIWTIENKFSSPEEEQAYLDEIASQEAEAASEAAKLANIQADTTLNALKTKTYSEVESWIDTETTWTVKEKSLVKGLAKVAMHMLKGI